jgi:CheY-like chemotaxis protein
VLQQSVTSDLSAHQGLKKNILVVNDEPDMTKLLRMALGHEGFSIEAYEDPVVALEYFKPNTYDIVILDIKMPKMDGFDLCNRLKMIDHNIQICFLTASTETYREELLKQKQCKIDKELVLEMPLPTKEIIFRIKKQMGL